MFSDAEIISRYTRAQAIEDGQLVDLSVVAPDVCRQHYKWPVACTNAVWAIVEKAVKNPRWMNDVNGVVHDILGMAKWGHEVDAQTRLFRVIITGAGHNK